MYGKALGDIISDVFISCISWDLITGFIRLITFRAYPFKGLQEGGSKPLCEGGDGLEAVAEAHDRRNAITRAGSHDHRHVTCPSS